MGASAKMTAHLTAQPLGQACPLPEQVCYFALAVWHNAQVAATLVLLVPAQGLQAPPQHHQAAVDGYAFPAPVVEAKRLGALRLFSSDWPLFPHGPLHHSLEPHAHISGALCTL